MLWLILAIVPTPSAAETDLVWDWLPPERLWAHPLADTRAPLSAVTLRRDYENGTGETLSFGRFIDATLAGEIHLLSAEVDDFEAQFGISGAVFMGFRTTGELIFDLRTFDGNFSFPLDMAWNGWMGRLQWGHTSAHTADGSREPAIVPPVGTGAWSREEWDLMAGPGGDWWRVYGVVTRITHAVHESAPWAFQAGGELRMPQPAAPYVAVDWKSGETSTWAGEIGVLVARGKQRLRVAGVGVAGLQDTGKLDGREERYLGLEVGFDATGRMFWGRRSVDEVSEDLGEPGR